ncbi:MAG TPA: tRNA lysidine(34) synthetase TilS [Rubricoccaceae bacterium]|nr:tRNA lysidine(34) synthetase TilS [Rubricoccaceae bacterium]
MDLPAPGRDVATRFGLAPGARLVVGASGGLDSTVLLRLLHAAGFAVVAAHVNYGLRGVESEADEAFVRALAAELGVPCRVRRVALPEGENRQDAARRARYAFFEEVARAEGAAAVAVAHHQDDQAETVLLHLLRGTGPRGLAGMPAERPIRRGSPVRLIRPLLDVPRAEVEALARREGWAWREDASNQSVSYRRNRLRRRILPELEAAFGPGVAARIAGTAARVRALLATQSEPPRRLPVAALRALPEAARHARLLDALRRWAPGAPRRAAAVATLDALLDAQPGRRVAWPGVVVWRDRDALVFEPSPGEAAPEAYEVTIGTPVETPAGTLEVTPLDAVPGAVASDDPDVEIADAEALAAPLVLRRWRPGDRLRPLGLDGTKRVSDLLTEAKVPPSERAGQLVLCAGPEGEVVWVVGHRLAEAARVRPQTRRTVRLMWTPAGEEAPPVP